jgi:aerobic-type carbon monoxide dehydrogenase small subunit (CoxS/CutS family)
MTQSRTDFGPGFDKWSWESEYAALTAGTSDMVARKRVAFADTAMRGGLSRRDFIKTVIAAAAVASSATYMLSTRRAAAATAVSERLVTLNVNGEDRRVEVLPQETLATTLRYKLGLTGTKFGCDRAECGACTVLLDDDQHYSCSTLTMMVRGRAITTIEGVSDRATGALHPVQQAFIDELGPQCGFCTPGQVMSAVSLLRANPNPTQDEARLWMSGNLCRCGAYDHYLKGVMRAAGEA